jgi:predicted transcriptional regulator
MKTESTQTTRTANVTVKLEDSERERLKSLAVAKKRTPHYIMREAIQQYLDQEEAEQRFIQVAQESLAEFKKTGEHITLNEFSAWVQEVKQNSHTPMPVCHK